MSTALESLPASAATYAGPASRERILADALGCILAGRPLPEALRAPTHTAACPASVEAGIARILAAPGA